MAQFHIHESHRSHGDFGASGRLVAFFRLKVTAVKTKYAGKNKSLMQIFASAKRSFSVDSSQI